jgi:hypothetical protein
MLGVMYEMNEKKQKSPGVTVNEVWTTPHSPFKYNEEKIIDDLYEYLKSTYGEHYTTDSEDSIQCFDAWIAMGDATPTFRNTAIKYLWRYGKKNGNNKKDLMKALHYIVLCLHNDHYKGKS